MPTTFMWNIQISDCRKIFGLLVAYVLYLMFGAYVFQYLEAPFEHKVRRELSKIIDEFDARLLDANLNTTVKEFKQMIHKYLLARDMNLIDQFGVLTNQNWNFHNSIFFSTTVITTIGYGHFLPSTQSGKIFCLVYALFGIPMTGVLLGAIGSVFSGCFMIRIRQIKRKYHAKDMNAKRFWLYLETGILFFLPWLTLFLMIPSVIFVVIERWSFLDSFYYAFITLTTIGFGDYVAGNYDGQTWIIIYKLLVVMWIIFGLSYLSMTLNYIGRGYKRVERSEVIHSIHSSMVHISEPFLHRHKPKITFSDTSDDEDAPKCIKFKEMKTSVAELDTLSVCSSHKSSHTHSHSHNHREDNLNVLPYIE